jgi:hypothetical protein
MGGKNKELNCKIAKSLTKDLALFNFPLFNYNPKQLIGMI